MSYEEGGGGAEPIAVGIAGITGYTGVELVRLTAAHSGLRLAWGGAGTSAGAKLSDSWPALAGLGGLGDLEVEPVSVDRIAATCGAVFLALPHGEAAKVAPALVEKGVLVVDLGADFRFRDAAAYERWYGGVHPAPEWLGRAVYGLPELGGAREALGGARLVAGPGCYPTAVTLASLPLVEAGIVDGPLVASCLSGVSGAGRGASARNVFAEVNESAQAYSIGGTHRHVPEMEANLGVPVVFSPHLVPMSRGIVATVHARLSRPVTVEELRERYLERFAGEPFVRVAGAPPATASVRGTNVCLVHPTVDAERGTAIVTAVIDNLGKGAAGQAVQAMNLALGLPETAGLTTLPVLP